MPIPDYESTMLPLLRLASDTNEHSLREAIDKLADQFALTDAERKTPLPSGRQATFGNRVGWARTFLKKAGLLESTRRGCFRITPRGVDVLKGKPPEIDNAFLRQFPEFVEFQSPTQTKKEGGTEPPGIESGGTPEEQI